MALTKEQLEKLHSIEIKSIEDATSRFSYKVVCSCGVEGLFYTKADAESYAQLHRARKTLRPY